MYWDAAVPWRHVRNDLSRHSRARCDGASAVESGRARRAGTDLNEALEKGRDVRSSHQAVLRADLKRLKRETE